MAEATFNVTIQGAEELATATEKIASGLGHFAAASDRNEADATALQDVISGVETLVGRAVQTCDIIPADSIETVEIDADAGAPVRLAFGAEALVEDTAPDGVLVSGKPFQIFPLGKSVATDGRKVWVTDDDAQAVVQAASTQQTELMLDYEHGQDPVLGLEAAGWMPGGGITVRDGGIVCTSPRWTPYAAGQIREKKRRYISGDVGRFYIDKEGWLHPRRLRGAGLVGRPAVDDSRQEVTLSQQSSAAATCASVQGFQRTAGTPLAGPKPNSPDQASNGKEQRMGYSPQFLARLGLGPDASEDAVMSAMDDLAKKTQGAQHMMSANAAEDAEAKAKADAEKAKAESEATARAVFAEENAKIRAEQEHRAKVSGLLSGATKSGRITVAEARQYEADLLAAPATFATVEGLINRLPVTQPVSRIAEPGVAAPGAGSVPSIPVSVSEFGTAAVRVADELGTSVAHATEILRSRGLTAVEQGV